MIHVEDISLPPGEAKQIREWLNLPAAEVFLRFLSRRAAAEVALAGNALVDPAHANQHEEFVETAKKWIAAREMIQTVKNNPDFSFMVSELKPKPLNPNPE